MQITYINKTIEKPLHSIYEEGTVDLLKRLGGGNYSTQFKLLKNFDLVWTFAINKRYKLTSDCIHFLEQGQFDEN